MTNEIHRKSLFQSAASSMGCISSQMVSFDQMAIRRIGLGVSNKISKLTLKGLFNLCSDNTTLYNNSKVCIRTTRHVSRLQNLFYWEKILFSAEMFQQINKSWNHCNTKTSFIFMIVFLQLQKLLCVMLISRNFCIFLTPL